MWKSFICLWIHGSTIFAHPAVKPEEQYRSLLKTYNRASGAFRLAKTDKQRVEAVYQLGKFAQEFLDIADKYPKDPTAIQAIRQAVQSIGSTDSAAQNAWEINGTYFPPGTNRDSVKRLVAILERDYLRSDKIGPICERMRWGYRLEFQSFLDKVIKINPNKEVRAIATLGLAQFLRDRLRMLDLVQDRPDLAKRYRILFGKDYLPKIQKPGRAAREKKIESLFEQAAKFTDVKLPYHGTVGEIAKSELYDLRYLAVGKTAPDIVGKDQDGKEFRLSEYRGKVVLLYFWVEF